MIVFSIQNREGKEKIMTFVEIQMLRKGKTPREACLALLERVGYYAFNRWAVKQGLRLEYVLDIHSEAARKTLDKLKGKG